ncbi:hypothetical protein GKZ68_00230 [Hymenobacter sp. BRD128]|uniref:hypothetical protein n=1 Tax=Hymenobacter sp. BRD128 TaxID=2675878 RepID=UPI0015643DDF|nr:hypothetical protein [Hymenobacter sp. BRD128]QKG55201.1 hypothetical protein GKZ68_00230 [Hymenobacter sp. BRD128]
MASKSLFQKQANKRTKTALKLRARYDAKVRKYATALVGALAGATDAKARLDRLNLLYGVDLSTETLLVHALRTAGLAGTLTGTMGASTPGEEVQLFNATADGNGGAALALEALFGELVLAPATPGSGTGAGTGGLGTGQNFDTSLSGPSGEGGGVTLAASAGDRLSFTALASGARLRLRWISLSGVRKWPRWRTWTATTGSRSASPTPG